MSNIYTEEETEFMLKLYDKADDKEFAVLELAEVLDRPKKSIIGKLSHEGVYIKKVYKTKIGEPVKLKKETIADISELLGADIELLQGLGKCPKLCLEYLYEVLKQASTGCGKQEYCGDFRAKEVG